MCPIIASDTKREFRPAPEGLYNAVCVDVVDRGMQQTQWGPAHKADLRWQIDEINSDNQKRFLVSRRYTVSLNEKATLRHHLEGWRGRPFSQQELAGFDLEKLIGIACQLQVVHRTTNDGTTFANAGSILPLAEAMPRLEPLDYVRVRDRVESASPAAVAVEHEEEEDEGFGF